MRFSITGAGHLEFWTTDLELARRFHVDALGFVEIDVNDQRLYPGGLEEREHHSLSLRLADSPGVSHLSFRASDPQDLPRLLRFGGMGRPPTGLIGPPRWRTSTPASCCRLGAPVD